MTQQSRVKGTVGAAWCLCAASCLGSARPGSVEVEPPYERNVIEVGGVAIEYLDFGGQGMPIFFSPAGSNKPDDFADFARRFVDQHRVLAITPRGAGSGMTSLERLGDDATRAEDIVAVLDALRIERVIVIGWPGELTYLAEHRPERLAGLVYLQHGPRVFDDLLALARQDQTGAMEMYLRALAVAQYGGEDHEEVARHISSARPRYMEDADLRIRVPALTFVNQMGTRGDDRGSPALWLAEMVASEGGGFIGDTVARVYFERLAADAELRARVQRSQEEVMAPVILANEQAFYRAFGDYLRIVPLEVPLLGGAPVVTGYEYRNSPDLVYSHIRRFLADVSTGREP